MPVCPFCGKEQDDSLKVCSNCGGKLKEAGGEALLLTVSDDMEAKIVESLLGGYGIPTLRKYRGSGDYTNIFMGKPLMGIDIFVPSDKLDEARDLMQPMNAEAENQDVESDPEELSNISQSQEISKTIFIWLFILPIFAWLVYALLRTIYNIFR